MTHTSESLRDHFAEDLKKHGILLTLQEGRVDLFSPYYGTVEFKANESPETIVGYVGELIKSLPVYEIERLRKQVKSLQDAVNAMNAQFEILQTMYDKEVSRRYGE